MRSIDVCNKEGWMRREKTMRSVDVCNKEGWMRRADREICRCLQQGGLDEESRR